MRGALVPMGIWLDILTLGATDQSSSARQKLALDLPLALRRFVASSRGSREYVGELPRAVTRFRYSLSDESERALLEALEREFVDAVVDDVVTGVEKSLLLVELCLAQVHPSLDELVHSFPWESSLKKSIGSPCSGQSPFHEGELNSMENGSGFSTQNSTGALEGIIAEQRKDVMNLSPKANRFIIEALEHYQTFHKERLRDERLTEDEIADLTNDCQYLEAVKTDLKKYHGELLHKLSSHVQES